MKFKKNLLQTHWANFNQLWCRASVDKGNTILYKGRVTPFTRKMIRTTIKIFSSPELLGQLQPTLALNILG